MFELVFLSGARAGAVVPISGSMIAGRSPDCDVEVPDPNASRHHSRVEWDGSNVIAHDNGSSNGTFVNEQRITEVQLRHGDVLRMGETRLRVQRRVHKSPSSSSQPGASSSVFGFREASGDLSQSLSLSVLQPGLSSSSNAETLQTRLNAIIWVAEALASITKLDKLYGPILETLFNVFPQAERAFLMLGETHDNMVPRAVRQRNGSASDNLTVSSSLCKAALERKDIMAYTDGVNTDFDQGMSLLNLNIRSAMVAPLIVKEEVLGLLVVDTSDRERSFNEDDLALAAAVCHQISIALKNAKLLEDVEHEVNTRRNLMRFLPRPVVDQAVGGELDLRLGGSTCSGAIFFADVIGFTSLSERLSPEQVVAMMNSFFNTMVPCIESENGAIDKFMGDCVMAFWGVPFSQEDAPMRAAAAGLLMQNALVGFNTRGEVPGGEILDMGVGFDFGTVVAGNVGSEDRVEYTVLGNVVNTASRIQAVASRSQVLVGQEAYAAIRDRVKVLRMPPIELKNKKEPVAIYSIRGVKATGDEVLLHVPVRLAGYRGVLVRRLSESTFILIHPADCEPDGLVLQSDLPELPDVDFGSVRVEAQLPQQVVDGVYARSLVQVGDPMLAGLLGDAPMQCPMAWEEMRRGRT